MKNQIARTFSILGHPALVVLVAVFITKFAHRSNSQLIRTAIITAVGVMLIVMVYVFIKTGKGDWQHIDASNKSERKQLNVFISTLLLALAVIFLILKIHKPVAITLAFAAALILISHAIKSWVKASLHTGFCLFAACLLWPNGIATIAFALFALFVAWSRLALSRHTRSDVIAGGLIGMVCGVAMQMVFHLTR